MSIFILGGFLSKSKLLVNKLGNLVKMLSSRGSSKANPRLMRMKFDLKKTTTGIFHHISTSIPIGSMYAIYGNIYHQYTPNVSIYSIHGSYWIGDAISDFHEEFLSNFHLDLLDVRSPCQDWRLLPGRGVCLRSLKDRPGGTGSRSPIKHDMCSTKCRYIICSYHSYII